MTRPPRPTIFSRAMDRTQIALAAAVVLLLLSSIFFVWQWLNSAAAPSDEVIRFSVAPPPDQTLSLFETQISRDGTMLVFASRQKGVRTLFVRSLEKFEMSPIAGTEDARKPFFSPDGRWIGYFLDDGTLKKVPVEGGTPLTICGSCTNTFEATWADDGKIVVADSAGLYRISAEGGEPERLIKPDAAKGEKNFRAPQVLPGGRGLLFSIVGQESVHFGVFSFDSGQTSVLEGIEGASSTHGGTSFAKYVGTGHLVFSRAGQLLAVGFDPGTMKVSGPPLPILEGLFALPNFHVADNGTLIYLPEAATDQNQLVWVTRQGERITAIDKRADFRSPKVSPDGNSIAVQVGSDIWVYEPETGTGLRLTFEGENQSPLWTPDGRSVVFASRDGNTWKILRISADGTGAPEELFRSPNRHHPYSFHPTEPLIALATVPTADNSDLVILSLRDGKVTPFLNSRFKEDAPRFSPDGTRIAYFSMESGKVEVYLSPWGPSTGERRPVSSGGGMYPVWSRNGREIFFRSGRKLLVTELDGQGGSTAGRPKILFEGSYLTGFDVSNDGTRFLMVTNDQGTMPTHLNVVLNWTEELKRAARTAG